MDIGIPIEIRPNEYRVGLTPQGINLLSKDDHRCYIQSGAGKGAGFDDADYVQAGGRIVYTAEEVYSRSDLVLKVGGVRRAELGLLRDEQTICAFWHLAARPHEITKALLDHQVTAVAYETIQYDNGFLPVLRPPSQIAGRMIPQVAARWLQNDGGGKGILISGLPGIPPIDVCIIGAGEVGFNAAKTFVALGAQVIVLDKDLSRLQEVDQLLGGRVVTLMAYDFNIARTIAFADVLVTAANEPGARAPILVTREMLKTMRPRSLIIDVSIDQGGCLETSRPTTHDSPVFVEEGILHYCVPNMTSVVARTTTHAYLNAAWPFIQQLANQGTQAAIEADPALRRGVLVHEGEIVNPNLAMVIKES